MTEILLLRSLVMKDTAAGGIHKLKTTQEQ